MPQSGELRVKSGELRVKSGFETRYKMFVGNGHYRSGIVAVITILRKIRIEHNIYQSEPEQASRFPTYSLPCNEYYLIQRAAKRRQHSLHS